MVNTNRRRPTCTTARSNIRKQGIHGNSLQTGSFGRESGKREKKEKGVGRERKNELAGMTFKQHLRPPVKL